MLPQMITVGFHANFRLIFSKNGQIRLFRRNFPAIFSGFNGERMEQGIWRRQRKRNCRFGRRRIEDQGVLLIGTSRSTSSKTERSYDHSAFDL